MGGAAPFLRRGDEAAAVDLAALLDVIDVAAECHAAVRAALDEARHQQLGVPCPPLRVGRRGDLRIGIEILLVRLDRHQLGGRLEVGRDQKRRLPGERCGRPGAGRLVVRGRQRRHRDDGRALLLGKRGSARQQCGGGDDEARGGHWPERLRSRNLAIHSLGWRCGRPVGPMKAAVTLASASSCGPRMTSLLNHDRGGVQLGHSAEDDEIVAEPRRLAVADVDLGDDIGAAALAVQADMIGSGGAQHVGTGALEEADVIGMVDDGARVGVLEIDRQRIMMLARRRSRRDRACRNREPPWAAFSDRGVAA